RSERLGEPGPLLDGRDSRVPRSAARALAVALGMLLLVVSAADAGHVSEQTVHDVAAELRCVVCQNLSVADSPSEMASQMRAIMRERLEAGETPAQVREYFVERYGEWILLAPRRTGFNLLVWGFPLAAMAVGFTVVALRELDFEHAAGHVSETDYAGLRARYEAETADTLRALDALGPAPAVPAPAEGRPTPAPARGWRHPAALGATAVGLLVFGVAIGVGIVRYTEPDRMADTPPAPGSRPLASLDAPSAAAEAPSAANAPRGPVTPQMLQGMLEAARASLFAGRY